MKNNDRGFKVIAVIALLIAVVGLSIAYAGYTTNLNVTGTATVASAWNVVWAGDITSSNTGYATLDNTGLTLDSTNKTVSGTLGTLKAPGDTISYSWYAKNAGEIDAKLTSVTTPDKTVALTCTSKDTTLLTDADAQTFCNNNIVVSFKYNTTDLSYSSGTYTGANNETLAHSVQVPVTMKLEYKSVDNATELPTDINVSINTTQFHYEQTATS